MFGDRGVIYDVDLEFNGEQEWYERIALSRPLRINLVSYLGRRPEHTNVCRRAKPGCGTSREPIEHPLIGNLFDN
ncbi:MAG: DNA-binding protein, partial [Pseudomonadota bacterium]|nr:DNA-binding protein [Pseudomonadota bacterium]